MSDEWDIEEPGSREDKESIVKIGKPYYGIIIHWEKTQPKQMIPHHIKVDQKTGQPVKSNYKESAYQTVPGKRSTVFEEKVVKWATAKDVLDEMQHDCRQACNSVKAFINKNYVLLYFHNGATDLCTAYTEPHWHVILKSEIGPKGYPRVLHDVQAYRNIKTKCAATNGGYVKAEYVRDITSIIRHMNCAPRIYMGCNSKALWKEWNIARNLGDELCVSISDLVEPIEGEDDDIAAKEEKKFDSWAIDDDDDCTPSKNKKAKWDPTDNDQDEFIVPPPSKLTVVVKTTKAEDTCRLLKILMLRYRVNNPSEMFNAITNLPPNTDENYKNLWFRLATKVSTKNLMETTLNMLKCETVSKSFEVLIDEYCKMPDLLKSTEYETPECSYRIFLNWCKFQRMDVCAFVTDIMDVVNKKLPKINTLCVIGGSNAGKTVILVNPIRAICRYVGMIGNRGNNSEFIYQGCVNCRLIVIEECVMDPKYYEDLKLIMGGETAQVMVKFEKNSTISRTPVILTGNDVPWLLDYRAHDAMRNRMHLFNVKSCDDLKDVKLLHPGMWWYLKQLYGIEDKPPHFSKLIPYPVLEPAVVVDEEDPLA